MKDNKWFFPVSLIILIILLAILPYGKEQGDEDYVILEFEVIHK